MALPAIHFLKPLISGYGSSFATAATILCTLFFSYFSYRLIEQPFRSRAEVSKRSLLTILIVAIFPIAAIGIGAEENGFKIDFHRSLTLLSGKMLWKITLGPILGAA